MGRPRRSRSRGGSSNRSSSWSRREHHGGQPWGTEYERYEPDYGKGHGKGKSQRWVPVGSNAPKQISGLLRQLRDITNEQDEETEAKATLKQFARFCKSQEDHTEKVGGLVDEDEDPEFAKLSKELAALKADRAKSEKAAEKAKIKAEIAALKSGSSQAAAVEEDPEKAKLRAELAEAKKSLAAQSGKVTDPPAGPLVELVKKHSPKDWDLTKVEVTEDIHKIWVQEMRPDMKHCNPIELPMRLDAWLKTEQENWSLTQLREVSSEWLGETTKVHSRNTKHVISELLAAVVKHKLEA